MTNSPSLRASAFQIAVRKGYHMIVNELTQAIVGAAIEVHRRLSPGLFESAYRICLAYEFRKRGFEVFEEQPIPVVYNEVKLDCGFRADLLGNRMVVV